MVYACFFLFGKRERKRIYAPRCHTLAWVTRKRGLEQVVWAIGSGPGDWDFSAFRGQRLWGWDKVWTFRGMDPSGKRKEMR